MPASLEQIREWYNLPLTTLIYRAQAVHHRHHDPAGVQLCTLQSIKTGRCPDEEPGLDNGKELQRCLYAVAVKALLGQVAAVEAALLYPGSEGNLYSLSDPSVQTKELIRFLQLTEQMLRSGGSVFGMGAESRYNDLAFALPANAEGVYFSQKAAARDAMVGDLSSLWGEN